jgi:hypothetical protein
VISLKCFKKIERRSKRRPHERRYTGHRNLNLDIEASGSESSLAEEEQYAR